MSISSHEDHKKICTYFLPHPHLLTPFSLAKRGESERDTSVCDVTHKKNVLLLPNRRSRQCHLGNDAVMSVTHARQREANLHHSPFCSIQKSSPRLTSLRKKKKEVRQLILRRERDCHSVWLTFVCFAPRLCSQPAAPTHKSHLSATKADQSLCFCLFCKAQTVPRCSAT